MPRLYCVAKPSLVRRLAPVVRANQYITPDIVARALKHAVRMSDVRVVDRVRAG